MTIYAFHHDISTLHDSAGGDADRIARRYILSIGMRQVGPVSVHHLSTLLVCSESSLDFDGNRAADRVFRMLPDRSFLGGPDVCASCHFLRLCHHRAAVEVLAARNN